MILVFLVSCTTMPSQPVALNDQGPQGETVDSQNAVASTGTGALPEALLSTGLLQIGSATAPHTLLLFVTPGSPYSQEYVTELLPQAEAEAVRTGQLNVSVAFIPFRKYPQTAAATAELICAAKQGKGQAMLSAIMQHPAALSAADTAPVDAKALTACVSDPATQTLAAMHASLASSLNVTLVPTAFLDGQKQTGLPEWTDLQGWINRAING